MQDEKAKPADSPATEKIEYEAPAIESVMSADDLTREVHYAGNISFQPPR